MKNGILFQVWQKHKENLILMERYHFFASSCRGFGFGVRSLSESMQDERESDGALATVLDVLKRIHASFFDMVGLFSSKFSHIITLFFYVLFVTVDRNLVRTKVFHF